MSRAQLTSTVEQNTGGAVAPFVAGKNKIINGNFAVNQRQFASTTNGGSFYTFDRFATGSNGGTTTWSAQTFTTGAAPVTGYEAQNFLRILTTGQSGASDYAEIYQRLEDVRSCAGQTVTFSFWAKANSGTPTIAGAYEQIFGAGGSSSVVTPTSQVTISTSWARYSVTTNVPSISGKTIGTNSCVQLHLFTSIGGGLVPSYATASFIQNNTIDFWGLQIENGSVATAFQTATGTIQGELAACQRYYWRENGSSNCPTYALSYQIYSATFSGNNPVVMRTSPSISQTYTDANYGTAWNLAQPTRMASTKTNIIAFNFFTTPQSWAINIDGGSFTPAPSAFQGTASNYIEASAEL